MRHRWLLLCIVGVAITVHLWAIRRDFPYIAGEDPTLVVNPAVRIASSGDLNPRRFVHPASTMIYPLAAAYHLWNAAAYGGSWRHADPGLRQSFDEHVGKFYVVGRLLAILYALLAIGVVYEIGRHAFGADTALIGTFLSTFYPTEVFNKQVRTENAALFFGVLALWCCLRLFERPTRVRQLLAGSAIGLAIATKYYLAPLVAVLLVTEAMILWRQRPELNPGQALLDVGIGLLGIVLGFALSTPYFFLDYATVAQNIQLIGLSNAEVSARGLRPLAGLWWYLAGALPRSISWPQLAAAGAGIVLVVWRRVPQQLVLLLYLVVFLVPLTLHPWQFDRWLIPVLPIFALLGAHGLHAAVAQLATRSRRPRLLYPALAIGVVALAALPTIDLVRMHQRYAEPSTYVLARQWVEDNLPHGSGFVYEWQTLPAPLRTTPLGKGSWINRDGGCNLTEVTMSKLSVRGSLDYYAQNGYRYLVTSVLMYGVYPTEPEHYPAEAAFYRELLAKGHLLHQVDASPEREGSEIRVYQIP